MRRKRFFPWLAALALWLAIVPEAGAEAATDALFSEEDLTLAQAEGATALELNGEGVEITKEGIYVLSGKITNGGVRIALEEEGTVRLLLDGVSVHNDSGSALYTENCKKVILTLSAESENTFSQGAAAENGEESAAIYSRDDLTLNGTGSLTVTSELGDGVNSRDTLRIVSGQITVTAGDDGLAGKDAVIIGGGSISVTAAGDGIKATNSEDAARGYVTLAGGDVRVTTGEGSSAQGAKANAAIQSRNRIGMEARTAAEGTHSAKGVKAVTLITVSGGSLSVDAEDDAIHSDGDLLITGGRLSLASGDDGMHANDALSVSGGEITVTYSYEGIEAADLTLSGGDIVLTATDDGINGAGGDIGVQTDEGWAGEWGPNGRDLFSSSAGTLSISGGRVFVTAGGDGIDVNGDIEMSGGEVYVRGPEDSGNGALDYDGSFTMGGGTLAAVGAAGMAQGVSEPSVAGATVECRSASGPVEVADATGAVLISFSPEGTFDSLVLYSGLLQSGQSYTVRMGDDERAVVMSTEGASGFGGRGGGNRRR